MFSLDDGMKSREVSDHAFEINLSGIKYSSFDLLINSRIGLAQWRESVGL